MRPKFQHENSYACLLAEVLEEVEAKDEEEDEKNSTARTRGELAAKAANCIVELASSSVRRRRRRRIGAATAAAASTSKPSTSVKPSAAAARPPPAPPPLPLLVERDDATLPEVLKFNRFIQTGYRRAPLSRTQCLRSLLHAHNETANVLSHLAPLLLLSLALASGALSSSWPQSGDRDRDDRSLLLHAAPVLLCLAGSVAYHLFMADSNNYRVYLSLDVCGVLALVVDGTRAMASRPAGCVAAAAAAAGLPSSPLALLREALVSPWAAPPPPEASPPSPLLSWRSISSAALARDAALASYAALVAFAAARVLRGRTAAERGLPLLALAAARLAVLAARAAEVRNLPPGAASAPSLRSALAWYARAEAASLLGGLFNVLRVPERWVRPLPPARGKPAGAARCCAGGGGGGCKSPEEEEEEEGTPPRRRLIDFAFNSHNLMHLSSLVALGCYHAAAAEDRRHWLAHGCGTGAAAAAAAR